MIRYDAGDARRIQHLTKVYEYAGLMGRMERLKKEDQEILEPRPSSTTSGSIDRKKNMAATQEDTRRSKVPRRRKSCWPPRDGRKPSYKEYPIWWAITTRIRTSTEWITSPVEADFLVNLFEEGVPPGRHGEDVFRRIFRTESGKYLFQQIFSQKTE